MLEDYLTNIKDCLGKHNGHVFWTGKPNAFVNIPLGKNVVSEVPKEMARWFQIENVDAHLPFLLQNLSKTIKNQLMDF